MITTLKIAFTSSELKGKCTRATIANKCTREELQCVYTSGHPKKLFRILILFFFFFYKVKNSLRCLGSTREDVMHASASYAYKHKSKDSGWLSFGTLTIIILDNLIDIIYHILAIYMCSLNAMARNELWIYVKKKSVISIVHFSRTRYLPLIDESSTMQSVSFASIFYLLLVLLKIIRDLVIKRRYSLLFYVSQRMRNIDNSWL